ncbi:MAG TPA: Nif3-like dinuclear metal center hexameric protein [Cyclobacteriaceae bacterium]
MFTENIFNLSFSRRTFITASASAIFLPSGLAKPNQKVSNTLTVQQVMDLVLKSIPAAPIQNTVDTLKAGQGNTIVTGIVTTMFATVAVIQKAIELKANFIIAHEPTFYSHLDETAWLENDKVWKYKNELLTKNNIAVWRLHDYIHSIQPDGVLTGVLSALGWVQHYNADKPQIVTIPASSLRDIVKLAKEKLEIKNLRVIGDLNQSCKKIALIPGAAGGRRQMQLIQNESPDVLLCGESPEWETIEYIRDANLAGMKQSLIVLGHSVSEEPGMEWLVGWLQPKLPGIPINHIASKDPFTWI